MNSLNNKVILPGSTIGIIGGGQLGRMMALSAKASGFRIAVLDPVEGGPCSEVAEIEIVGNYDDKYALKQLADVSDVITFEFENINSEALDWLQQHAYVPQGTELLRISQDRIQEKERINASGAKTAPYFPISELSELYDRIEALGLPCVLKTARGGYDGKGQLVIRNRDDIAKADALIKQGTCVLEAWVPFTMEISVIVVRKVNGETSCFPVAENVHVNNILHQTIVPARIPETVAKAAIEKAMLIADAVDLVGIMAVEMFVKEDGEVIINELAPRPHNTGHFSIEACKTSQFEQHIRAICNWPLGNTDLYQPAVMVNILGQHMGKLMETIPSLQDWKVHLYGKKDAKNNRKMGHVNILKGTSEEALSDAKASGIWEEGNGGSDR
ncbi:5-(carboxyamino)imidazole ribonucleotide synthase [Peribacillus saganii]|uniref:N5-carboxyaminoimidazole ribonucleotide synthase n=1 Tax=Peribacillus saganii TaxID=2303992 RepID=A0A372LMZ8_9BACI|nr:5-(carboxyamino)imidazole ribonucleotide synthase [Peribacillus saganii]RFU68900.1 5-(carboxyamino)imidazole ribonucleotide synthase [Peribacillus saganii]